MAGVTLERVSKRYAAGAAALSAVDLHIPEGAFVALLGPSGSGKTTLLRAIAGLERIDGGRITLGGRRVADGSLHVPPQQRGVGVVFQNHALWPHLSALENVAFALRAQGVTPSQALARARQALAQVGLQELAQRRPAQLSGGQCQRVALARAWVAHPRCVLLDEPLASLDTALRRDMMTLLQRLHQPGQTVVYVTHNQEEARALADRVVVLRQGHIEQQAAPETLCLEPANAFVARFVGGGNCLPAACLGTAGAGRVRVALGRWTGWARCADPQPAPGQPLELSLAPTALSCAAADDTPHTLWLEVDCALFLGLQGHAVQGRLSDGAGWNEAVQVVLPGSLHPRRGQVLPVRITDAWVLPSSPQAPSAGSEPHSQAMAQPATHCHNQSPSQTT